MPKTYLSLDSEKYFTQSLLNDKKLARKQANKSIMTTFFNSVLLIVFAVAAIYAIKTMPEWLPTAEAWFHSATNYKYA